MSSDSAADDAILFTVVTPTYNRAHTLPRLYESLRQQTFPSFEWLVVDDGSTDGTDDLVAASWIEEAPFPIRYLRQLNSGKNVCENRGAALARGMFLTVMDSDDWYLPEALETFAEIWNSIDASERDGFAGAVAHCSSPPGALIGDPFPQDVLDTDYIELRRRYRVAGDKAGCARTVWGAFIRFPRLGRVDAGDSAGAGVCPYIYRRA